MPPMMRTSGSSNSASAVWAYNLRFAVRVTMRAKNFKDLSLKALVGTRIIFFFLPFFQPGTVLRSYSATFSTFHNFSHDVLEDVGSFASWQRGHVSGSFNLNAEIELLNYWEVEGGISLRPRRMDRTATRGGPLMVSPRSHSVSLGLQTDRRRRFNVGPEIEYDWFQLDAGFRFGVGLEMEFRPSSRVRVEVEPQFVRNRIAAQYVATAAVLPYQPTYGRRYLFGDLERREVSVETRLDIVFSPTMSLQLFAQPLLSSGDYVASGPAAAAAGSRR